jgi:hypothetical protein
LCKASYSTYVANPEEALNIITDADLRLYGPLLKVPGSGRDGIEYILKREYRAKRTSLLLQGAIYQNEGLAHGIGPKQKRSNLDWKLPEGSALLFMLAEIKEESTTKTALSAEDFMLYGLVLAPTEEEPRPILAAEEEEAPREGRKWRRVCAFSEIDGSWASNLVGHAMDRDNCMWIDLV